MLYKSPEWKKNYQNLVKTTSFERYFSKRDVSSFFGGRGKISLGGAPAAQPQWKKARVLGEPD